VSINFTSLERKAFSELNFTMANSSQSLKSETPMDFSQSTLYSIDPRVQVSKSFSDVLSDAWQAVINFFVALSNRDSVGLKDNCTADILLFETGSTWNSDTLILKAITLNTATDYKRTNTFDFINTTVADNTAWVTYDLHSEITRNGKQATVQWMETVILIKEKQKWKIKVLHSTPIKRN